MTPKENLNRLHADQKRAAHLATTRMINHTSAVMQRVIDQKNMKGCTILFALKPGRTRLVVRRADGSTWPIAASTRLDPLWSEWRVLFVRCHGFNTTTAFLVAQNGRVRYYSCLSSLPKKFREDASTS